MLTAPADPLAGLVALGSWLLVSVVAGLGVAICSMLLADVLVSVVGLEPARSSELAQEVQALRAKGTAQAEKRRLQREFFVTSGTLEALVGAES